MTLCVGYYNIDISVNRHEHLGIIFLTMVLPFWSFLSNLNFVRSPTRPGLLATTTLINVPDPLHPPFPLHHEDVPSLLHFQLYLLLLL